VEDFPSRASLRAELIHASFSFGFVELPTMSDYDDEMDVDAPSKDVQFSSESAGKKRTAADLPVEAQDNLPWSAIMLPG
jgi:hypothetical protein